MYLGIDIGTSKAAAVVADTHGAVHASASCPYSTAAFVLPSGRHEQDCESLLCAAWSAVRQLPEEIRAEVRGIGVTGQMHGLICCNEAADALGPLITWQDQRVLEEESFLSGLTAVTERRLAAGFGAVTLAWLVAKHELPAGCCQAATIADLAIARLCGSTRLLTDPTNAASWGLFDLASGDWDWRSLGKAGIPLSLLPTLVPCGMIVGSLRSDWSSNLGLPAGIPLSAALGDNQASMVATLRDLASEMALTLGSGGQLSAVLPADAGIVWPAWEDPWELRPFPGGRFAVVAASPAGGAAWRWLADSVRRGLEDLGLDPIAEDQVFLKLNQLGLEAQSCGLSFSPHFLGERSASHLRASVSGIDPCNFRLGPLARELACSIVRNLRSMLPGFAVLGRTAVVGSGNALRWNPLLLAAAQEVLKLPVRLPEAYEEAALGAALIAAGRNDAAEKSGNCPEEKA